MLLAVITYIFVQNKIIIIKYDGKFPDTQSLNLLPALPSTILDVRSELIPYITHL